MQHNRGDDIYGYNMDVMKEYLFYTQEGRTDPPLEGKEVNNCQLLGLAQGMDGEDAKGALLRENAWIVDVGFDPELIRWYEVVPNHNY